MSVPDFAPRAAAIATALQDWHVRYGPHEGVRPDAFVGAGQHGSVALRAVRPNRVAAVGYAAPEETGRLSFGIDERTDLYALGVLFYELLTGALPFPGPSPERVRRGHLTVVPARPGELVDGVPEWIDEIVLRLLQKAPQDRYQTAHRVAAELSGWSAEHDVAERLGVDTRVSLQPRLAGLRRVYERIATTGAAEVVAVTGVAGLGKATLVSSFGDTVVLDGGRVVDVAGTPDEVGTYPVLTALLSDLGTQLAEAGTEDRRRVASAVGRCGAELAALAPQLAGILDQPGQTADRPVPGPVPGAGYRLYLGVRRLFRAVAAPDRPLVVAVRDVQWADASSVALLHRLLRDPGNLPMLLLATATPATRATTEVLLALTDGMSARLTSVKVRPLPDNAVAELLTRRLGVRLPHAAQLARSVAARAGSSPLLIDQVLAELADRRLLTFQEREHVWESRHDDMEQAPWGATVAELVARRVDRLPEPVRRVLHAAALLGWRFDAATLAAVAALSADDVAAAMRQAVLGQFVVRHADPAPQRMAGCTYRWIHEQVRAAVRARVPAEERERLNLDIGRALAAQPEPDRVEAGVSRLNASAHLLPSSERRRLAAQNQTAGRRAATVDANDSAWQFFTAALALLDGPDRPDDADGPDGDRIVALCLDAAHAALRRGDQQHTTALLERAAASVRDPLDRARLLAVRVIVHHDAGDRPSAVTAAIRALATLGAGPAASAAAARTAIGRVRARLATPRPSKLAAAETATDTATLIASEILATLLSPAHDGPADRLLLAAGVELALDRGRTSSAALAFACLAMHEARCGGGGQTIHRYLQTAHRLVDATPHTRRAGAVRTWIALSLPAWLSAADAALTQLDAAHSAAEEEGDIECAATGRILSAAHRLTLGHPLRDVARSIGEAECFAERSGVTDTTLTACRQLASAVARLRGLPADEPGPDPNDDDRFSAQLLTGALGHSSLAAISGLLTTAYLLGDTDTAADLALAGDRATRTAPGTYLAADIAHTQAMLLAERGAPDADRRLDALQRQLDGLAARAPALFAARALLVAAARATAHGPDEQAQNKFDRAIRAAREQGCLPLEARAAELGGRHALAIGRSSEAVAYLRRARECYTRWGATAKAAQINETLAADPRPGTQTGQTDRLELLTVLRAFQTITAELRPDRLIPLLLTQFVEHSGAERGELYLVHGDQLRPAGAAYANPNGIRVTREPLSTNAPADLAQRIRDDQRTTIDASATRMWAPINHGGTVTGVLYLEHDPPATFTHDRVDLMDVLCAQAGIALDNATTHASLARANHILDAAFDQLPLGLILLGPDLTVLRASAPALTITGLPITPGTPLVDLIDVLTPTDTTGTPLRYDPALATEALTTQPTRRRIIIVLPTGQRRSLIVTAAPLRDATKTLVAVVIVITEQPANHQPPPQQLSVPVDEGG